MNDKLLPCPFCGGKATIVRSTFTDRYAVKCPTCGASLFSSSSNGKALCQWNKRSYLNEEEETK